MLYQQQPDFTQVLQDAILNERNQVFQKYWDEGYLGRVLLFLIDKLVQACVVSFEMLRQEHHREGAPPKRDQQVFVLSNLQRIEKRKRVKVLKYMLSELKAVRVELEKVEGWLNGKEMPRTDLIKRIQKVLE